MVVLRCWNLTFQEYSSNQDGVDTIYNWSDASYDMWYVLSLKKGLQSDNGLISKTCE